MFLDASALIAMMTSEDEARNLASRLQRTKTRLTSPLAVCHAAAAVSLVLKLPMGEAEAAMDEFLELAGVKVMSLPAQITPLALEAFRRFGKGQGHPADLSMTDCFAYACARYYRQPLLHKGGGFARTDLETA
ncbi:type II toxin-antitoxin system VapC family toxin [Mangrovicella endophytica]|uniref:type II toxin-antitoxin system VapC family toxin n=1 Tax=Mangrovicella endophytica TaxID=2066697 RepID=UPI000C9DABE8|nr:type II toxin-antitoxin system VapC family toxin [Mangrovicella endophytica]